MSLSLPIPTDDLDAAGLRVAMVVSEYHASVTHAMRDAAVECFLSAGGSGSDLRIIPAAGAFELVPLCAAVASTDPPDALVAIGCIIAGETTHDQHLAEGVIAGLVQIMARTGVPIALGVLTCQSLAQARSRAGGSAGNKGVEAMAAALRTAQTIRNLHVPAAVPGERG